MRYRTEWKYICSDHTLDILEQRIKALFPVDQNANQAVYHIHSLYFDDYGDSCAFDNDAGSAERMKWRIRYYDDDSGFIRLERKRKHNDLCYKQSCILDRQSYDLIIEKRISELFWKTDERLLQEFCVDVMNRLYRPRIIIDYERTAYAEPIADIRITFDRNISASLDTGSFLENDYYRFPLQEKGMHVLEVKFDDVLPGYVEKVLHSSDLQRNTFSKYYLGRTVLERNLL